jgi:hypothetical protein
MGFLKDKMLMVLPVESVSKLDSGCLWKAYQRSSMLSIICQLPLSLNALYFPDNTRL